MMFELGVLCNELAIYSIKDVIIQYFENKMHYICCICGKTTNIKFQYNGLYYSNKKKAENINNFINELIHYFCEKCYYMNINNSSGFNCQNCKVKHYFYLNN